MTEPAEQFLRYPTNRIVAVLDEPDQVATAIDRLSHAGFDSEEIRVLCGEEGAQRLDATGERHGLLARLTRILQSFGGEDEHVERHAAELRAGHFVLGVHVGEDEDRKTAAHAALQEADARFVNYYGEWSVEQLDP
ncbi:MAG: hypothetical protein ACRDZO_08660 [Egibacteraceae bacterium]